MRLTSLPSCTSSIMMLRCVARSTACSASEGRAIAIVDRYATLSPREREVMALVTADKMNKQIAGELRLSEVTVKIHCGPAMRKMGARSLADLVRMADTLKNRTR